MKIWKRIISAVMVIAMLTSSNIFSIVANAEGETGSITIHKYEVSDLNDYTMSSNGTELAPNTEVAPGTTLADLKPLENIPFKITAVQLKSTAIAGSTTVSDYEPIPDGETDAYTNTERTESYGTIIWDNLPLGLYLIEELGGNTASSVVAPFIVRLPLTNPEGTEFVYDVHVYPKNEVTGPKIDKNLIPPAANTGSNILTWRIGVEITNDINDSKNLVITDVLDTRIDYVTGSARGYYVNKDGDTTNLNGSEYSVGYIGNTLTFTITPLGFTTLNGALSGAGTTPPTLYFEFGTMIRLGVTPIWDIVTNSAVLEFTNSDNYTYTPKVPEIPPTTNLHGIEIYKTDNFSAELSDAKFKIYPTQVDANARTNALKDPANPTIDWEITTIDGYAYFNGLSYGTFWIVETQASPEYNLISNPIEVIIADNATAIITQQVINNKGFTLPITGGFGTIVFTVAGLLLIGAGCTFLFVSMKKKEKEDNNTGA